VEEAVKYCTTCGCVVPVYDKWDHDAQDWVKVAASRHGTPESCIAALRDRIERLEELMTYYHGDDDE
jgi:hypothetical protein